MLLAEISVSVQGIKSSKEKFAGSLFTTTVEAFVPATGKGIQVCMFNLSGCQDMALA